MPGEHLPNFRGARFRPAHGQGGGRGRGQTEILGPPRVFGSLILHRRENRGRPAERDLVQSVFARQDIRHLADIVEHVGHEHRLDLPGDAHDLRFGPRGVDQGADHVEDRSVREALADQGQPLQRRVKTWGEQEGDPNLLQAADERGRLGVVAHPKMREHLGAARVAGGRAVAVLGDAYPARGHHDRGGRRDVHRVRAVAAGAAGVEQRSQLGGNVERQGVPTNRRDRPREFGRDHALDVHRREEG